MTMDVREICGNCLNGGTINLGDDANPLILCGEVHTPVFYMGTCLLHPSRFGRR